MSETCNNANAVSVRRLCALIHRSLHQFPELKQSSSKHETEKDILVSLSQIVRQIRHWINNEDTEQQESYTCPIFDSQSAEHECLPYIVSILISLLNVDNKYIHHLVGNNFLVIAEYLLAFGDNWDTFIRLLCVSFEFGLGNIIQPSVNGVENLNSIPAHSSHILNWNGVTVITRVLRGIVKDLKGEEDAELVGIVFDLLSTSLSEVPWNILNDVQNDTTADVRAKASSGDGNTEVKILLAGNIVQLLCSLIGLIGSAEAVAGSLNKNAILHKICDIVPKVLRWCLAEEQSFIYGRILAYFQHKFLMLMIRLSFHMQLDRSISLLWLQLLHEYFQDLLSTPLSVLPSNQDDSLEDSPFLLSLYDQEVCHLSSCHLQRQTVFLFIRCCLSLIDPRNSSHLTVGGKRTSSLFDNDSNTSDNYFVRKKGLLEFYGWLQEKAPLAICSENQMHLAKCIKFISSFVRLYMHEDDMLFEVLLQMLWLSSCSERIDRRSCCDTEGDILLHISNLFNPLLVLHVLLSELQYDHQLLLDYLISKDTGSKCAEYLLRSLRTICDSWNLFLQLLAGETHFCQSNYENRCKKMRTFPEDSCAHQVAEQYEKEDQPGTKVFLNYTIRIEDAKLCLLSLKCAMKKLHKKRLFPYNPEVLIRRITRFEVLCDQNF
ncbi:uncharacterized protein LOC141643468 isoform X1 [Silene latifolia]|uniref:uncharacterized protein LOC141643468 isoform X1 n=1 Tax=Silene latifolia TaxID=37657 RepID=UPI003D78191D